MNSKADYEKNGYCSRCGIKHFYSLFGRSGYPHKKGRFCTDCIEIVCEKEGKSFDKLNTKANTDGQER